MMIMIIRKIMPNANGRFRLLLYSQGSVKKANKIDMNCDMKRLP